MARRRKTHCGEPCLQAIKPGGAAAPVRPAVVSDDCDCTSDCCEDEFPDCTSDCCDDEFPDCLEKTETPDCNVNTEDAHDAQGVVNSSENVPLPFNSFVTTLHLRSSSVDHQSSPVAAMATGGSVSVRHTTGKQSKAAGASSAAPVWSAEKRPTPKATFFRWQLPLVDSDHLFEVAERTFNKPANNPMPGKVADPMEIDIWAREVILRGKHRKQHGPGADGAYALPELQPGTPQYALAEAVTKQAIATQVKRAEAAQPMAERVKEGFTTLMEDLTGPQEERVKAINATHMAPESILRALDVADPAWAATDEDPEVEAMLWPVFDENGAGRVANLKAAEEMLSKQDKEYFDRSRNVWSWTGDAKEWLKATPYEALRGYVPKDIQAPLVGMYKEQMMLYNLHTTTKVSASSAARMWQRWLYERVEALLEYGDTYLHQLFMKVPPTEISLTLLCETYQVVSTAAGQDERGELLVDEIGRMCKSGLEVDAIVNGEEYPSLSAAPVRSAGMVGGREVTEEERELVKGMAVVLPPQRHSHKSGDPDPVRLCHVTDSGHLHYRQTNKGKKSRSTQKELNASGQHGAAICGAGWCLAEVVGVVGTLMGQLKLASGYAWSPVTEEDLQTFVFREADRNVQLRITLNGNELVDGEKRWVMTPELPFNLDKLGQQLSFWPGAVVEFNFDWNLGGTFESTAQEIMSLLRRRGVRVYDASNMYREIHSNFPTKAWHPTKADDPDGQALSCSFEKWYLAHKKLRNSEMLIKTGSIARQTGVIQRGDPRQQSILCRLASTYGASDLVRELYTVEMLRTLQLSPHHPSAQVSHITPEEIVDALERQKESKIGEIMPAYLALDSSILFAHHWKFTNNPFHKPSRGEGFYNPGKGPVEMYDCEHFMHSGGLGLMGVGSTATANKYLNASSPSRCAVWKAYWEWREPILLEAILKYSRAKKVDPSIPNWDWYTNAWGAELTPEHIRHWSEGTEEEVAEVFARIRRCQGVELRVGMPGSQSMPVQKFYKSATFPSMTHHTPKWQPAAPERPAGTQGPSGPVPAAPAWTAGTGTPPPPPPGAPSLQPQRTYEPVPELDGEAHDKFKAEMQEHLGNLMQDVPGLIKALWDYNTVTDGYKRLLVPVIHRNQPEAYQIVYKALSLRLHPDKTKFTHASTWEATQAHNWVCEWYGREVYKARKYVFVMHHKIASWDDTKESAYPQGFIHRPPMHGTQNYEPPPAYQVAQYPFWMQNEAEHHAWDHIVCRHQKYWPLATIMQLRDKHLVQTIQVAAFVGLAATSAENTFQAYLDEKLSEKEAGVPKPSATAPAAAPVRPAAGTMAAASSNEPAQAATVKVTWVKQEPQKAAPPPPPKAPAPPPKAPASAPTWAEKAKGAAPARTAPAAGPASPTSLPRKSPPGYIGMPPKAKAPTTDPIFPQLVKAKVSAGVPAKKEIVEGADPVRAAPEAKAPASAKDIDIAGPTEEVSEQIRDALAKAEETRKTLGGAKPAPKGPPKALPKQPPAQVGSNPLDDVRLRPDDRFKAMARLQAGRMSEGQITRLRQAVAWAAWNESWNMHVIVERAEDKRRSAAAASEDDPDSSKWKLTEVEEEALKVRKPSCPTTPQEVKKVQDDISRHFMTCPLEEVLRKMEVTKELDSSALGRQVLGAEPIEQMLMRSACDAAPERSASQPAPDEDAQMGELDASEATPTPAKVGVEAASTADEAQEEADQGMEPKQPLAWDRSFLDPEGGRPDRFTPLWPSKGRSMVASVNAGNATFALGGSGTNGLWKEKIKYTADLYAQSHIRAFSAAKVQRGVMARLPQHLLPKDSGLAACFARLPEAELGHERVGVAILDVFSLTMRKGLGATAGAMVYVVGPKGNDIWADDKATFLRYVRETASNALRLVYEYNRHVSLTANGQLPTMDALQYCLVSGGIYKHPDCSLEEIADHTYIAMKSTYGTFYEQIAPKVNFAWTKNEDNGCAFRVASAKESGGTCVELQEDEGCRRPHVDPVTLPVARSGAAPERSAPAASSGAQVSDEHSATPVDELMDAAPARPASSEEPVGKQGAGSPGPEEEPAPDEHGEQTAAAPKARTHDPAVLRKIRVLTGGPEDDPPTAFDDNRTQPDDEPDHASTKATESVAEPESIPRGSVEGAPVSSAAGPSAAAPERTAVLGSSVGMSRSKDCLGVKCAWCKKTQRRTEAPNAPIVCASCFSFVTLWCRGDVGFEVSAGAEVHTVELAPITPDPGLVQPAHQGVSQRQRSGLR